jgi:hypothetical protein
MPPAPIRRHQAWQGQGVTARTTAPRAVAFKGWHSALTVIFSKTKFQQFIPVGTTINLLDGFTLLLHRASLSASLSKNCSNNTVFYSAVFQFVT